MDILQRKPRKCNWASQVALVVKNSPANVGDAKRNGFNPWVVRIPWSRKLQHTPVFLPGESHGQRAWWTSVHRLQSAKHDSGCTIQGGHKESGLEHRVISVGLSQNFIPTIYPLCEFGKVS